MKTRRQLWWRKKKSRWKGERTARLEHQTMLATTTIHIQSSCMAKRDAFRSSIAHRPYPPHRLRRRLLRHIALVKSQEDNQWIQLKGMLIKGPVPTTYTIVQHSFRLTFRERRTVRSCCLFHALKMYPYSLSFHTTFVLSLSYENPTNCSFHRILITEIYHL